MSAQTQRLAVLIDAENAQAALLDALFSEIAKFGGASVKRAYGDFTHATLSSWRSVLLKHSIQAVQQFNNTVGKNASDIALIIDAMDLIHSKRFDGFCLVSSDDDFTRLASRIREEGLLVYGFGEKKTPQSFIAACDKFIYTEILRREPNAAVKADASPPSANGFKRIPLDLLRDAVESCGDEAGWAHLAQVGQIINNRLPDFDCRSYGYKTFMSLPEASGQFDMQRRGGKGPTQQVFARVKAS